HAYLMPYVNKEIATDYLRRLAKQDVEEFIKEVDRFCNLILQSSEHVDGERETSLGILLKRGYWDLVPLNCFWDEGRYLFYDQEFYEENYPANAMIYKMLEVLYVGDTELEAIVSIRYFWKRYHLEEQREIWQNDMCRSIAEVRHQSDLQIFYEKVRRNPEVTNTNRQRMNYSDDEYRRIFVDIFFNAENKKIILFGSGNFTNRFLVQFRKDYQIDAIVDNDSSKWGSELEGIPIKSAEYLKDISQEDSRIIICVKKYAGVICQLQRIGITDYCIYDPNVNYAKKRNSMVIASADQAVVPKKYPVGYIAGVFDLFHIGHLNMFKRAKEQCDYLIVGVLPDAGVRHNKKANPFIPFQERMEIVKACRYVDEVIEIPLSYGGIKDAFRMVQFDCKFSGSDYQNNPDWLADKQFLEKQGAEMVFFPYTEDTSSTKIKQLIEQSLL
ncbi:MAG: adenylyltransferase/cytidyltransferase family protein, partial [Hungatella sp.]